MKRLRTQLRVPVIKRILQTKDGPVAKIGKQGYGRQCGSGERQSKMVRGHLTSMELGSGPYHRWRPRMLRR